MVKYLQNLLCHCFGHELKYNFPSIPNKCICARCKMKMELNLVTLVWENVETFDNEERTDEELCEKWI